MNWNLQILIFGYSQLKGKDPLYSIILQNLQLPVSLKLTNQCSWGFLLNVSLKMPNITI